MAPAEPHIVDIHVGQRLRLRRKIAGLSQGRLAAELGLTFQQLQKYERGANRISASKLYLAAKALRTSIGWFFEGLPDPAGEPMDGIVEDRAGRVRSFLASPQGLELAAAFPRLPPASRPRILALINGLAHDASAGDLEAVKPFKTARRARG